MEANNSEVYQLKQTIAECEKRRPGLLVWGIILLLTGLVVLGMMELFKRLLWDWDIIDDFDSPVPGIIIGVWIVGSIAMILAFILGSAARKRHGEEATQRLQEVLRSSSGSPMSTPSYGAAPTYGTAPMNNTGYGAAPTYGSAPMNNTGYGAAPTYGQSYPTQPTYDPNPAPTYTAPEQTYEAPAWNPTPAPAPEQTYEVPAWNPATAPEQTYAMPTWESTSTPVAEPAPAPEPVHSFDSLYDSAWNPAGTPAPEAASNPGSESNPESPKGFKPVGKF